MFDRDISEQQLDLCRRIECDALTSVTPFVVEPEVIEPLPVYFLPARDARNLHLGRFGHGDVAGDLSRCPRVSAPQLVVRCGENEDLLGAAADSASALTLASFGEINQQSVAPPLVAS